MLDTGISDEVTRISGTAVYQKHVQIIMLCNGYPSELTKNRSNEGSCCMKGNFPISASLFRHFLRTRGFALQSDALHLGSNVS